MSRCDSFRSPSCHCPYPAVHIHVGSMSFTKLTVISTIFITALRCVNLAVCHSLAPIFMYRLCTDPCIWRGALFYACYTYLLRSIYHDLQTLTGSPAKSLGVNDEAHDDSDMELDVLPVPSTAKDGPLLAHAGSSGVEAKFRGRKNWKHSSIARLCFSLCFSESCTLFLLFMCQELSLLNPRWVIFNNKWTCSLSAIIWASLKTWNWNLLPLLWFEVMLRSRILNWRMSLFLVLAMILLVIPLTQNFLLTYQSPLGTLEASVYH